MEEKKKNEDTYFGLLQTSSINEIGKKIKEHVKKFGYKISDEKNIDDGKIIYIKKTKEPNWELFFKNDNEIIEQNTNNYRIVYFKYDKYSYYIEKNGGIKINNLIDEDKFHKFNPKVWKAVCKEELKRTVNKNFKEKINDYMKLDIKKYYNGSSVKIPEELSEKIDNIMNINECLNLFEEIPELEQEKSLENYVTKNCKDANGKSSETVYNKKVCEKNKKKYILLDCVCNKGVEVADIYDIDNKLLFHNKKGADLRTLSIQIMLGVLTLKDDTTKKEYMDKLKKKNMENIENIEKIDKQNYNYVAGIINKKNSKINYKDKLSLGITYKILKECDVKLYINKIPELE